MKTRRTRPSRQADGKIPRTHLWPLVPGVEARQRTRAGHTFAVVDLGAAELARGADGDVSVGALPREAVFASYEPRRRDPSGSPHSLLIRLTSASVGALAGVGGPSASVDVLCDPKDAATAALHWLLVDEHGERCDAKLLARYRATTRVLQLYFNSRVFERSQRCQERASTFREFEER